VGISSQSSSACAVQCTSFVVPQSRSSSSSLAMTTVMVCGRACRWSSMVNTGEAESRMGDGPTTAGKSGGRPLLPLYSTHVSSSL